MSSNINKSVLNNLYNFLLEYYKDKILADAVISGFLDPKTISYSEDISSEILFNLLGYIQKISGDQLVCFNAGRYFSKNDLSRYYSVFDFKFSVKNKYRLLPGILESVFPFISISIKTIKKQSIELIIQEKDSSIKSNLYFYKYLQGIISSIPELWNLPFANTVIKSLPFRIENILQALDIFYQEKNSGYYLFDKKIALQKSPEETADGVKNGGVQVIVDDLYIKDLYLRKDTALNCISAEISATWKETPALPGFLTLLSGIAGVLIFVILYFQKILPVNTLILSAVIYYILLLLIRNKIKFLHFNRLYEKTESELLKALSEQRYTASEALLDTQNRLRSIENIIDITKNIIYEKNLVNLFDTIRKTTARALNADRATVFIHDSLNHELRSGPELSEEAQEFRIPETKGIAGEVFKLKKTVNIKDAYNNPNFDKTVDRKTSYHTKTILGAPLIDIGNNFIGIIQVLNKKGDTFDAVDEKILETLSTYIASALKDSLNFCNMEQRPIDPVIQNGIGSAIQYLYNKSAAVNKSLEENGSSIEAAEQLNQISAVLKHILFVFNGIYTPSITAITVSKIRQFLENIINSNNKNISFSFQSSLYEDKKIYADENLLNQALQAILINSIEAIDSRGEISISVYNFIKLPNLIMHEFSIFDLVSEYNKPSERNTSDFIDYLKKKKPLLDSDLERIMQSAKRYIAFDIFDDGKKIQRDIIQKIFHPFFSGKNQFGLGLPLALSSVKIMSGMVEEPVVFKNGKIFRFLLPDKQQPA